jgi:hypothetical protein
LELSSPGGCGFREIYAVYENGKIEQQLPRQKEVHMSPVRRANGSPNARKIARQTPIGPTLQTERDAIGPSVAAKKRRDFDPHAFLATIGEGRKSVLFQRKQGIFAQGDAADAVFYIQTGKVKLTVVSKTGEEATSRRAAMESATWITGSLCHRP